MQAQMRELQHLVNLWGAANDAKARKIAELEHVVAVWNAADDAKTARIDELEDEAQMLREQLTQLRGQVARLQRALGVSMDGPLKAIPSAA